MEPDLKVVSAASIIGGAHVIKVHHDFSASGLTLNPDFVESPILPLRSFRSFFRYGNPVRVIYQENGISMWISSRSNVYVVEFGVRLFSKKKAKVPVAIFPGSGHGFNFKHKISYFQILKPGNIKRRTYVRFVFTGVIQD